MKTQINRVGILIKRALNGSNSTKNIYNFKSRQFDMPIDADEIEIVIEAIREFGNGKSDEEVTTELGVSHINSNYVDMDCISFLNFEIVDNFTIPMVEEAQNSTTISFEYKRI